MLVNGDDGAALDHRLVCIVIPVGFVLVYEGYDVSAEHVGTGGLVCSLNGLKILANVCERLLWVITLPLGLVLLVEIIVVLVLLSTLKV